MNEEIRYVCLDTETTGLRFQDGDRVFDIGCVEICNGEITREFQKYVNPNKIISKEVEELCKVDGSMFKDKPNFETIADDFINFLNRDKDGKDNQAVLVIHNAKFDLGFLNHELSLINKESLSEFKYIDTVKVSRVKFQGKKASLDALCERLEVNLEERKNKGHGALLDSLLLANVFLKLFQNDDPIKFLSSKKINFYGFKKHSQIIESIQAVMANESESFLHDDMVNKFKLNSF
jgi:DNA polymerase-3 subunit epsilon